MRPAPTRRPVRPAPTTTTTADEPAAAGAPASALAGSANSGAARAAARPRPAGRQAPECGRLAAGAGALACDPVIPAKGSVGVGCAVGGKRDGGGRRRLRRERRHVEPLGGRDACAGAEAAGADAGGAAMDGGRDTDLGAAPGQRACPRTGRWRREPSSPEAAASAARCRVRDVGRPGSAAAASSRTVARGRAAAGGVRCCTGGGADAPATAAITPDAASEM